MEKQIIRTLHFNNETVNFVEPVYIDVHGNQMRVLMRIVVELNNKVKELKEQLDAK